MCSTFCGLNLMGTLRFAHPTFFALHFTLDFKKAPLLGLFCGQKKISPSPSFSKRERGGFSS